MENKIPAYIIKPVTDQKDLPETKGPRLAFLDKTILNSARAAKAIYVQAENSTIESLIQKINPHIKLISLIYFLLYHKYCQSN